jgi:hypothetical protein
MKIPLIAIMKAVDAILGSDARKATVYLDENTIVRATRQRRPDARSKSQSYILTLGKPAFADRRFIRLCKQAGGPLPVRKVQLKFWPEKKK